VRWHPLEVDLLAGLEAIGRAPAAGPRHVVGPPGAEDEASLARLLVAEGRAFHEVERDVATRRAAALEKAAAKLKDGVEHDRRGRPAPRALPGEAEAAERLSAARRAASEHERALERLLAPDAERAAVETLRRLTIAPRRDLEALKARAGPGDVVEVLPGGWPLAADRAARLAARRAFLGLPEGRDWA